MALRYLCNEYPDEFDGPLVAQQAAEIVIHDTSNNSTKLAAIQVATMMGEHSVEPTLITLVQDTSVPLALRLSAIAGLGNIKSGNAKPILSQWEDNYFQNLR